MVELFQQLKPKTQCKCRTVLFHLINILSLGTNCNRHPLNYRLILNRVLGSVIPEKSGFWFLADKLFLKTETLFGSCFRRNDKSREALLCRFRFINCYIYCSGKSGSMTLLQTLDRHFHCLHVHNNLHFQTEIAGSGEISVFECIEQSFQRYKEVFVIDSYRLPVERVISSFFQNIETHLTPEDMELDEQQLLCLISDRLDQKIRMEHYHSINEVMTYFNAPPFSAFDFEKGFNLYKQGPVVFIKLRFADIDRWGDILSELFRKKIILQSSNLSREKPYSGLYTRFKDYYRVPAIAFAEMTNSREFRIYTTEGEKAAYLTKWKARLKD